MGWVLEEGAYVWRAQRLNVETQQRRSVSRKRRTRSVNDKLKLLTLAKRPGNVTKACKEMGFSRDSYYRFKRLGKARLEPKSPRPRLAPEVEAEVLKLTREHPEWGKYRVAENLSYAISPNGVRGVWRRHRLSTPSVRFLRPGIHWRRKGSR